MKNTAEQVEEYLEKLEQLIIKYFDKSKAEELIKLLREKYAFKYIFTEFGRLGIYNKMTKEENEECGDIIKFFI